jgi:hypothetical protein
MPINKKKKPTLTKALSAPVKRISPREISQFKNKENQQAFKATLKLNALARAGKKSNHIIFNNNLKNPTIKVDTEYLKKPRNAKELIKAQRNTINKNKPARVTPGLPTVSRNKVGKGIKGQQTRQLLKYQRQTHSRILQSQLPKAGYISPGKGGYPSHTVLQKGRPRPAVTATGVGVAKIKRRKK